MTTITPLTAYREQNEGHGHVFIRPDNARTRCAGHNCEQCKRDRAILAEMYRVRDEAFKASIATRPVRQYLVHFASKTSIMHGATYAKSDEPMNAANLDGIAKLISEEMREQVFIVSFTALEE